MGSFVVAIGNRIVVGWYAVWRFDVQQSFGIPGQYAEQLVDGVRRDLVRMRYGTFNELCSNANGVASTVDLMSMHIIGFQSEDAIPYAIKSGVALIADQYASGCGRGVGYGQAVSSQRGT